MSRQRAQLLDAFEALPDEEKRAFTAEFLRRVIPLDSGPLDDDETASRMSFLLCSIPKRMTPTRGEVWLFDLGTEGKVRTRSHRQRAVWRS